MKPIAVAAIGAVEQFVVEAAVASAAAVGAEALAALKTAPELAISGVP